MNAFDRGRAVADAVLFEGYALYPYRASSTKNQLRWQFGVLMPRAGTAHGDPWWLETQLLVAGEDARVRGKLRFLRLRRREVELLDGTPAESLDVDGQLLIPWDEGEVCEHDFDLSGTTIDLPGDRAQETVRNAAGEEVARVVRTRGPLSLRVTIDREPIAGGQKLRARLVNLASAAGSSRDALLPSAALGAHLLFSVEGGDFVSLMDPPERFAAAAAGCKQTGLYPVLAGEASELVLASPIILYDHPKVAPESPGDLFDATEIDEILTLRTLMLTDEEKRQARATDARVAALIDRVDALPREVMSRLHGAFRDVSPVGKKVRLRPGPRRTDAQDMFLEGRVATVQEVKHDVDGRACLAVTVDDDPANELHLQHGRYHYFYADEVEPL